MEIGKEKVEKVHKFEIDLSSEEYALLKKIGLELIIKDEEALINYAVNYILAKEVDKKCRK
jgi:hypothetical protein